MASLADLGSTGNLILASFAGQLEAQKVEVPERRYVHFGREAVWDQAQLVVGLLDIKQGQPGLAMIQNVSPLAVTFTAEWHVVLVRIAATLSDGPMMLPDENELEAGGLGQLADISGLIKAFTTLHQGNVLTASGEGLVMAGCRPAEAQGGLVATELLLDMSVR